mgnify:CR=1 FL=1
MDAWSEARSGHCSGCICKPWASNGFSGRCCLRWARLPLSTTGRSGRTVGSGLGPAIVFTLTCSTRQRLRIRFCGALPRRPSRSWSTSIAPAESPREPEVEDLAVDGRDVMCEGGVEAGPEVGMVLAELLERVLEDPEMNDREKLLDLLRRRRQKG